MAMGPSELQLTAQRAKLWGKKFTSLKKKKKIQQDRIKGSLELWKKGSNNLGEVLKSINDIPYVCKHLNTGIEESSIVLNSWTVCFPNLAVCFSEENNSTSNNFQGLTKQMVD